MSVGIKNIPYVNMLPGRKRDDSIFFASGVNNEADTCPRAFDYIGIYLKRANAEPFYGRTVYLISLLILFLHSINDTLAKKIAKSVTPMKARGHN